MVLFSRVFAKPPAARIMALTRAYVDWDFVLYAGAPGESARMESLVSQIRSHLSSLRDVEDGAIDADGTYVFIASLKPQPPGTGGLNCSGFAKWVVDGFYRPIVGENIPVADVTYKGCFCYLTYF